MHMRLSAVMFPSGDLSYAVSSQTVVLWDGMITGSENPGVPRIRGV